MSTHYEWMPAGTTSAAYLPAGYDITTCEPSTDRYEGPVENRVDHGALLLCADEVVVLEGTLDEIDDLVERITHAVRSARLKQTHDTKRPT